MALSRSQVSSTEITVPTTSNWTSGSFSADADDLIVVVINWSLTDTATYSPGDWSVTSTGMTFTRHVGVDNGGTSWQTTLEIYSGIVPSGGSRTVTVSGNSKQHFGVAYVYKYSGVNTTTPVRQSKELTVNHNDGAYSYNLDSAPLSTSEVLAGFSRDISGGTTSVAPGTGWTELYDLPYHYYSSFWGAQQAQYRSGSTSTSISYDDINVSNGTQSKNVVYGAIEIAEAPPSSTGYSFSMIY